jgi:hypothetical protein
MGHFLLDGVEEVTLVAHAGGRKSQLVLQSSPPPVTKEASDHAGRGPKRRTATMPSTPMASTASAKLEPPAERSSWFASMV